MKSSSLDKLKQLMIGKTAKANHPITCLNPTETFIIVDVKVNDNTIFVRGENTCWFGSNSYEIL